MSGPTVPGSGESFVRGQNDGHGQVFFNALRQNQRPALTLVNGVVYVAWASHNDLAPFHGWVAGYDARTLKPVGVFNTTPNAVSLAVPPPGGLAGGGIWQAGGALAATRRAPFTSRPATVGLTPLRRTSATVSSSSRLAMAVSSWQTSSPLSTRPNAKPDDIDLGSGRVLLLPDQPGPHPHLLVTAGKGMIAGSTIYLLDRDNLGKFHMGNDNQIVQSLPRAISANGVPGADNGAFCTPAYFNNRVYYLARRTF